MQVRAGERSDRLCQGRFKEAQISMTPPCWRESYSRRVSWSNCWRQLTRMRVMAGGAWRRAHSFHSIKSCKRLTEQLVRMAADCGAVYNGWGAEL
jgi:hypothetical protein